MKKIIITALVASIASLSSIALAKPAEFQFSTHKFDYQIPKKLTDLCQQRINTAPEEDKEWYTEKQCMRVDIELIKTNYPFIDKVVNGDYNDAKGKKELKQSYDEDAEYVYEELQDKENTKLNQYERSSTLKLIATSANLVQISRDDFEYNGGPHGIPARAFYVFDMQKQKELKLDDILISPNDKAKLTAMLKQKFINYLKNGEKFDEKMTDEEIAHHLAFFGFDITDNFYLTPQGITFAYNVYEIAPYADGFIELQLTNKELKGFVKNEYLNQKFDKFDSDWSKN
nr:RsiV family protein [uncultured Moraxella sp.]